MPMLALSFALLLSLPQAPLVLKAQRLYDGRADALTTPGLVVVDGEQILATGPKATVPAGAQVIDLGDATLMPGLIDAHTHLTFEATTDWNQDELDYFKKPVPQVAIESTVYARRTLLAGFTTVRDLGSYELVDVGLRNAINAGKVPGPRMLVAAIGICTLGGHCDPTGGYRPGLLKEPDPSQGVISGPEEGRTAVRWMLKYGADVIKVHATGGVLSLSDTITSVPFTQEELDAIIDEAHAHGKKVAAHAHSAPGAKRAIRAGVDSIEHGTMLDEEALGLMKGRGTVLVYTPTPCLNERLQKGGAPANVIEKAKKVTATEDQVFQRALKLGVSIAFGSDSAVCPHGTQGNQFAIMVKNGMKPAAALRSATSAAAKLLGVDDKLGAIEPGKLADLIAVPGDALQDMKRMEKVSFVMKGGKVELR